MIWLFVFGLIAYVVYLDQRLGKFERRLDALGPGEDPYAEYRRPAEIIGSWEQTVPAEQPPDINEEDELAAVIADESPPPEPPEPTEEYGSDADEPVARSRILDFDFEELFGRRLPIWAGGITLAVAGMLIVKLSIDSGLLTPPVRVLAGLIFGVVLIAAAEFALRQEDRVRDPRVRQSLAGAGLASLYASILVATNTYGLIDPFAAMLAMAAVTGLALFLATRFGAPSALLGLVGGLAAPALVGSDEPNVPLLSLYLALAVGGLCTLSRNQRWAWLGISALIGGFGWGLLLLLGGALDAPSSISLGLYLLLLGVGIPALGFAGDRRSQLQLIAGIVAAAQMAALVATGGFALLNWGLFALLSLASLWLAQRDTALERLPAVGLLIALLLIGAWPDPSARDYALVVVGTILIYGPPAWWRLWRSEPGLLEAAQLAALGLGGLLLPMLHFYRADGSTDLFFGMLGLGLALVLGGCAALGWRHLHRRRDVRFVIIATAVAHLLAATASLLLPTWLISVAVAAIGFALLHLGQAAENPRFEPVAWIFAAVGALVIPYSDLFDGMTYPDPVDLLRWALMAAIAGLFAWRAKWRSGRSIAQFLAPVFLYFALSSILPSRVEALVPPLILVGLAWAWRRREALQLAPAMVSAALMTLLWALEPILTWSAAAAASLMTYPVLVTDVPGAEDAVMQLLAPGLLSALAMALAGHHLPRWQQIAGLALAGVLTGIGVHSLYKQVFAIASPEAFVALGVAERLLWQVVLVSAGAAALRLGKVQVGLGLAVAGGAAHLVFYSLLLHNPLWWPQAVGPWPIVNLLTPLYALAFGLTLMAQQSPPAASPQARRLLTVTQIFLVLLFAFSTLRQLFHGTLLVDPGLSAAEDIGRSILAIALAIGFLVWGIVRQQRDWRIASLVLMLAAVVKVFLFDASGLEGLVRIASFIALGFSLIGIGWLYARHLAMDGTPDAPAMA